LFFLSALVLLAAPAFAGERAQGADSFKTDSIDRCGNPKAVSLPLQNRTASIPSEGAVERGEKQIVKKGKGTAYFFLGSLCPCTDAHKHSIMELMSLAPKKGIKLVAVFPNKGESAELVEHFRSQAAIAIQNLPRTESLRARLWLLQRRHWRYSGLVQQ